MELDVTDTSVAVFLTHDEALRLGVALTAGCETVTRAEYFIRTGLSEAEVRRVAGALMDAHSGPTGPQTLSLAAGVEEVENPRRPRPDV
jgi:hypothetical protein